MKIRSVTRFLALAASMSFAGSLDAIQGPWAEILQANVKGDRVDYAGVQKERAKFDSYLKALATVDSNVVKAASKEERTAFYINAYNAGVFDLILRNPKAGSVSQMPPEISGTKFLVVAAETLSLGDIQRKKVLDVTKDARLWSLFCDGSLSSAPIFNAGLTSTNLESLSEERTRLWLADTSRNKIDAKTTKLATIPFDYFRVKQEFKTFPGEIPGFVKKFGPASADPDKNRPTYFYNSGKNSVAVAAPAAKGKKKK